MSTAEAACIMDQIRSNTSGNISAYLIEATVKCGKENPNNLGAHLYALGVPGNLETRGFMRQIKKPGVDRYSIIAVVGKTDINGKFEAQNLIFNLGKLDINQDQLVHLGTGHFLVLLDLNGNPVNTVQVRGFGLRRTSIWGEASLLTDYQQTYWKNYFDSIHASLPVSGPGMDR